MEARYLQFGSDMEMIKRAYQDNVIAARVSINIFIFIYKYVEPRKTIVNIKIIRGRLGPRTCLSNLHIKKRLEIHIS